MHIIKVGKSCVMQFVERSTQYSGFAGQAVVRIPAESNDFSLPKSVRPPQKPTEPHIQKTCQYLPHIQAARALI